LHGDPGDHLITGTVIAHDATLITADDRLLRWRGKVKRQHANK
jgi:PIN domain nuclease of toxin-antitoxin system